MSRFHKNRVIVFLQPLFILTAHGMKPILRALPLVSRVFAFRSQNQTAIGLHNPWSPLAKLEPKDRWP